MMEILIVDAEGKVTIPQGIIRKRELRPGDELAVVEAAEGLLLYQGGADAEAMAWWKELSEEERREAKEEAHRYWALSDEERDALWQEEPVSIEEDAEGDEIELPAKNHSA
jgi:bifunctional DNA-binding transcriptional regulator/antitoxin component of YhaV-PrlF toxin-antitoxin module